MSPKSSENLRLYSSVESVDKSSRADEWECDEEHENILDSTLENRHLPAYTCKRCHYPFASRIHVRHGIQDNCGIVVRLIPSKDVVYAGISIPQENLIV